MSEKVMTFNGDDSASEGFTLQAMDRDVRTEPGLVKLPTSGQQRAQVSALVQQMPTMMAAATLSECYIARFPDGVDHTLTALKQGGFMSTYKDEKGLFSGTASLYKTTEQAVLLGAISAMAAVSGQYYLRQINQDLSVIKMGIDKILEFLYGDKKAELMSEVSFVKYAYENYSAILGNELQRLATITNIQQARKVAMKDIEFYMSDLDSTVRGKDSIDTMTNKALQIKESLDLSLQLYVTSVILEVYYAQNYESEYLNFLERDVSAYIDKCEKRMLSSFSILSRFISDYKGKLLEKVDKSIYERSVEDILDSLNTGKESDIRNSLHEAFRLPSNDAEYYLTKGGDIYIKA